MNKRIQTLATVVSNEVDETSDLSPVVTVSRRNLRRLLEEILADNKDD